MLLLPTTLTFLFPCEFSCNARCRQVLQSRVFPHPNFSSPPSHTASKGSSSTGSLPLGHCSAVGPPCPAPKCHHVQSNTLLIGRKKNQGTPAGRRLLGKTSTACQTCPRRAKGTFKDCSSSEEEGGHGWLPAPERKQTPNTATSRCSQQEGTRASSTPPSDFQTKKQAVSVRNLRSANRSDSLKQNIPPADTGQQLPSRNDHKNTAQSLNIDQLFFNLFAKPIIYILAANNLLVNPTSPLLGLLVNWE